MRVSPLTQLAPRDQTAAVLFSTEPHRRPLSKLWLMKGEGETATSINQFGRQLLEVTQGRTSSQVNWQQRKVLEVCI